ncbi:MAG: hypothetical protein OHK0029_22310 [Armatimonadaceae bacterium]
MTSADSSAFSYPDSGVARVGIIGDVHTEDGILEAALRYLSRLSDLDALLCTGDVVSGPGDAGRCCDLLAEYRVLCVRGNHDRWCLHSPVPYQEKIENATAPEELSPAQQGFLTDLPPVRSFPTPQGPLLLCHGLGEDDMVGVYPGDTGFALESNHRLNALIGEGYYRYVINGHTHQRMVRTIHGLTILNAGTLRRDHKPVFSIADLKTLTITFFDITPFTNEITQGKVISINPIT